VIMLDLKNNLLKTYKSTREATKDGFSSASVSRACNNVFDNGHKYKNFVWKYT
jgi:hypothetical protein